MIWQTASRTAADRSAILSTKDQTNNTILSFNLPWFKNDTLGLFQKLSWGDTFFFSDPSTPRTHMGSEPPDSQHTPHYGSNMPWLPGQVTPHSPTPRAHCQQNTLPPQDKKVSAPPLKIISGTALSGNRFFKKVFALILLWVITNSVAS